MKDIVKMARVRIYTLSTVCRLLVFMEMAMQEAIYTLHCDTKEGNNELNTYSRLALLLTMVSL